MAEKIDLTEAKNLKSLTAGNNVVTGSSIDASGNAKDIKPFGTYAGDAKMTFNNAYELQMSAFKADLEYNIQAHKFRIDLLSQKRSKETGLEIIETYPMEVDESDTSSIKFKGLDESSLLDKVLDYAKDGALNLAKSEAMSIAGGIASSITNFENQMINLAASAVNQALDKIGVNSLIQGYQDLKGGLQSLVDDGLNFVSNFFTEGVNGWFEDPINYHEPKEDSSLPAPGTVSFKADIFKRGADGKIGSNISGDDIDKTLTAEILKRVSDIAEANANTNRGIIETSKADLENLHKIHSKPDTVKKPVLKERSDDRLSTSVDFKPTIPDPHPEMAPPKEAETPNFGYSDKADPVVTEDPHILRAKAYGETSKKEIKALKTFLEKLEDAGLKVRSEDSYTNFKENTGKLGMDLEEYASGKSISYNLSKIMKDGIIASRVELDGSNYEKENASMRMWSAIDDVVGHEISDKLRNITRQFESSNPEDFVENFGKIGPDGHTVVLNEDQVAEVIRNYLMKTYDEGVELMQDANRFLAPAFQSAGVTLETAGIPGAPQSPGAKLQTKEEIIRSLEMAIAIAEEAKFRNKIKPLNAAYGPDSDEAKKAYDQANALDKAFNSLTERAELIKGVIPDTSKYAITIADKLMFIGNKDNEEELSIVGVLDATFGRYSSTDAEIEELFKKEFGYGAAEQFINKSVLEENDTSGWKFSNTSTHHKLTPSNEFNKNSEVLQLDTSRAELLQSMNSPTGESSDTWENTNSGRNLDLEISEDGFEAGDSDRNGPLEKLENGLFRNSDSDRNMALVRVKGLPVSERSKISNDDLMLELLLQYIKNKDKHHNSDDETTREYQLFKEFNEANKALTREEIHMSSALVSKFLFNTPGKPMKSHEVLSIMDAAKNKLDVTGYVTNALIGTGLMDAAKAFDPAAAIQGGLIKELYSEEEAKKGRWTKEINLANETEEMYSNSEGVLKDIGMFVQSEIRNGHLGGIIVDKDRQSILKEIDSYLNKISNSSYLKDAAKPSKDHAASRPLWYSTSHHSDAGIETFGLGSLLTGYRANRVRDSREYDYFQNGYWHVFFVKPDLNLTENCVGLIDYMDNPMLGDLITNLNYNNQELSKAWLSPPPVSKADYSNSNPYISWILSNSIKSCPIQDISLGVKESWENVYGAKMSYGTIYRGSTISQDINLTFNDTNDLFIMNMIQMWVKYIATMREGVGDCGPKYKNFQTLDYCGALYGFVTDPDGVTIRHWFRYTGIYPTSVPWSSIQLSTGSQDIPEFSVGFKSQFYETNDVAILRDFNYIMNKPYVVKYESSDRIKGYAELSSIDEVGKDEVYDLGVANLLGGPLRTERHVNVNFMTTNDKNGYKFILNFKATPYGLDKGGYSKTNKYAGTGKDGELKIELPTLPTVGAIGGALKGSVPNVF